MNKKMILAALLMVNVCSPAIALNEEPRAILYALDDLGQNLSSVSMIVENIDMYIGMLQMNMQITKAQLKKANDETKKALWNGARMLGAAVVVWSVANQVSSGIISRSISNASIGTFLNSLSIFLLFGCSAITHTYSGMNVYDAFKAKNALEKSLALDKKILHKLEELKASLPEASAKPDSAAKKLLGGVQ